MQNSVAQLEKRKLVMVGNGMAGMRTVEHLLKFAPDTYDITVFGSEPFGNYNRIMLSPVLAGEMSVQDIMLHDKHWYAEHNVTLHCGKTVTNIDRYRQCVIADDGTEVPYDRVLLATGSSPFILPIPGKDLPGVITYRDIFDVERMLAASKHQRHAVVIGGGLLGLEAANGLRRQGMDVTVVHRESVLMERQLDAVAGGHLQIALEARGIRFLMGHTTERLLGDADGVQEIVFTNGLRIPADLVVMAVGIRPNIELAKRIGLTCDRGVLVNDTLATFDPRIYAVGECAQHRGIAYGLVAPLYEQAKVCASHLAEHGVYQYLGSTISTQLKVTGIEVFSAGDFHGDADSEILVYQDSGSKIYRKLVLKNDRIQGVILYGDSRDGGYYFEKLQAQEDIAALRDDLIFGRVYATPTTVTKSSPATTVQAVA